ncbi:hypothetical protein ACFX11_020046 [Malus domestica]
MDLSSGPSYLASLPVIVSSLIQQGTGPAGSKYGCQQSLWCGCGSVRAADVDAIAQVAGADWNRETVVYAHKSGLLDIFNSSAAVDEGKLSPYYYEDASLTRCPDCRLCGRSD